ncbi:MAG: DNA adenine methylase [Candidatus Jettenia sp.]|uniref:site-specific DNA-methyltransferase (adenine-specific) n=1 Tax=Candidatus Jettenia caeni TaxID=247490 RepID=I3IK26_9BACT|nr:DNA adenine methylase [Candidatus Jettenia sp. AMX1]MBC6928999.1 DNA adenine methylase [Candidatus Jettenia sp.]NUN24574.1 DNA adenine methylase [Candidatus Jettenia caeni]KAA0249228.1 MAG: DNA adenine methylase [Candidatus Jettenia sp. AMX1]MCE7881104.1 DNA adenine methylase [Candidatus Jettenia sp. AMX1]MCQ3927178.1 DNA adenine methylase [Candidatus Jettenia sp.]
MIDKCINSPFRYAGGKFYARKLILQHIPPHKHYIEPFAGGASIFFAKKKVLHNQLNDLDKELINVYKAIRDYPDKLILFLTKQPPEVSRIPQNLITNINIGDTLPATKELHFFFKKEFNPVDDIERAGRWFYLNRTSYSGIMNIQNMYWGYGDKYSMQPKNWAANIHRTSYKLQNVQLTSLDFEKIIDKAPDGAFLFIDPPYFNADQDKFYSCIFSKADHFRLKKCLQRNTHRLLIFVTYDNSPEIKELYSWMKEIHDKEWNYCIQRTDDQRTKIPRKGTRYKGKEIFILNYSSHGLGYKTVYQKKLLFTN